MTKTEFIRKHLDIATQRGAFNLEQARALANVVDQLEIDLKALQQATEEQPDGDKKNEG